MSRARNYRFATALAAIASAIVAGGVTTGWTSWPAAHEPGDQPDYPSAATGDQLVEQLTGVDHVPSRRVLDELLGANAPATLGLLARGHGVGMDLDDGVRIRAYRALELYPEPATVELLSHSLTEYADAEQGVKVIYLRAIVRSLAITSGPAAAGDLRPLLLHNSRDIRAAAADALAITGTPEARTWLSDRLPDELDELVRTHIQQALHLLGESL